MKVSYLTIFNLIIALCIGCGDGGFVSTKSGDLEASPEVVVMPTLSRGERFTSQTVQLRHSGEAPVKILDLYIETSSDDGATFNPRRGCDRVTENIEPSLPLGPDVLPECDLLISERPIIPSGDLNNNQLEQVVLSYRTLNNEEISDARLVIETNIQAAPTKYVEIQFAASGPAFGGLMSMEPFPTTGPSTGSYILRNVGSAPLIIQSIIIESDEELPPETTPEGNLEYTWDTTSGTVPGLRIEAQSVAYIEVKYQPINDDSDRAYLVFKGESDTGQELPPWRVTITSEEISNRLEVTPNPVNFSHNPGNSDAKIVNFRNTGLGTLDVFLSISPEGTGYELGRNSIDSFQLPGGQVQDVTITYQASGDVQNAELVIRTNADNADANGEMRVPLTAGDQAGIKSLSVTPAILNFDGVAVGESSTQTITVSSSGTSPVTINTIQLTSTSDMNVFTVNGGEGGTLMPGDTQTVDITFTRPMMDGPAVSYQAELEITGDQVGGPSLITLLAAP